ncbi:MAG: hypothetical protein FJ404_11005 [Verrucomicrobia bacterium]|nr:hypothetical protein [Verrucomicrobiota bacterium]
MTQAERHSFFRQGGWMMISTTLSGGFMFAVHLFAPLMPKEEYGLFGALLGLVGLMMIPVIGLQTTLAQQTAACLDREDELELAGTLRSLVGWSFLLWIVVLLAVWLFQSRLLAGFKISNPAALWMTAAVALPQLWLPIFMGYLQGRQNFLWFGWATVLNGLGRFASVGIIVAIMGGYAAGAMVGVLLGFASAFGIALWHSRQVLSGPASRFEWGRWVSQLIPLTLGLGTVQFILYIDLPVVRQGFEAGLTGSYAAAGMIGRGLVVFTTPLSIVLFPKLVRSATHAEPTKVLGWAVVCTAALGALAALGTSAGAWSIPWLLDQLTLSEAGWAKSLVEKLGPERRSLLLEAGALIPWFVWAMLPLAIANVLISSALARRDQVAVYGSAAIGVAYGSTIAVWHPSLHAVIGTLGGFNLLLLLFNAWRARRA